MGEYSWREHILSKAGEIAFEKAFSEYVLILSLHCREDSSLKLVSTHNKAQCVQCVIPSAVLHLVIIKLARLRSSGVSPDVTQPAITSHRGARIKTNLNGLSSPRLRTLSSPRLKTPAQCSASLLSEQSRALLWQPGGWLDLGDCTTQHSNTKDTAGYFCQVSSATNNPGDKVGLSLVHLKIF